jgi:hypothetical protein
VSATAALAVVVCLAATAHAQTRRTTPRRPAPPAPPATKTEPAMMTCPQVLGEGVRTKRQYCDVLIGRDPAGGILITLPPHSGNPTLTFDLHNRHTYSEELVKANRAYSRYTATIGVLTLDNTLVSRAIVQNEFRTQADLVDRISGGSGPSKCPTRCWWITSTSKFPTIMMPPSARMLSLPRLNSPDSM